MVISFPFINMNKKKSVSIENSKKVGKSRQAGWRRVVRANHLIDIQFHIIYSNGKTLLPQFLYPFTLVSIAVNTPKFPNAILFLHIYSKAMI